VRTEYNLITNPKKFDGEKRKSNVEKYACEDGKL
jgi:hypothetical protein